MEEKMLKSLTKTALAATALSVGTFVFAASAEDAKIKHISLKITVPYKSDITVTSSDGEKWDTILPTTIPLWADIVVDTYHPGYVEQGGIFLDNCRGRPCRDNPRIAHWTAMDRDWKFHGTFNFDTSAIADSRFAMEIFNACNAELQPDGASQEHSIYPFWMQATLSVNTRKAQSMANAIGPDAGGDFGGGDVGAGPAPFAVKVKCVAFQTIKVPEAVSVDVLVKPKGETCPKETEITARIKYQQPATARFRFKRDGEPSGWISAEAKKLSGPKPNSPSPKPVYLVEHVKTYHLDPGQHHFRIELQGSKQSDVRTVRIECPPFQGTSMWLTLKTEDKDTCPKNVDASVRINGNGPGSVLTKIKNQAGVVMAIESIEVERVGDQYIGRLKKAFNMSAIDTMLIAEDANDSALNSGWQPLKVDCLQALSGELTLQSLGATSCKGEALVAIHTNGTGELPYELECGPGKSWQRKVTAMANKIGVDKVRFDVTNNELVTCALRTRIGGVLKSLDGASRTFECHKPTGVSDVDDFVPDTRPDPQKPHNPGTIVIDPPRPDAPKPENSGTVVVDPPRPTIACVNGRVVNGACDCEPTMKRVKAGKNAWRCVIDPKPEEPTVSEPKISCTGGTPKNGTCTCARTHKPVKAGKNAWRCVKVVVSDPPRNKDGANMSGAKIKTDTKPSAKKGKAKTSSKGRLSSSALR
jgi:hypothetical protein